MLGDEDVAEVVVAAVVGDDQRAPVTEQIVGGREARPDAGQVGELGRILAAVGVGVRVAVEDAGVDAEAGNDGQLPVDVPAVLDEEADVAGGGAGDQAPALVALELGALEAVLERGRVGRKARIGGRLAEAARVSEVLVAGFARGLAIDQPRVLHARLELVGAEALHLPRQHRVELDPVLRFVQVIAVEDRGDTI